MTAAPVTLFRGTFLDTPQSPFTGGHLRADADAALVVRDGVIVARGPSATSLRRAPRRGGRRPARGAGAARVRRHPRALPTGARHRRSRHAAAGLARTLRAARGGPAGRHGVRRLGRGRLRRRAGARRHHDGAGLRVPLRRGRRRALRRGHAGRAAGDQRPGAQRPDPARGPVHHPRARPRRRARAGRALARPSGRTRYAVTPRFSLSCSDDLLASAGALLATYPTPVHLPPQREPHEIAGVRELFGCDYATSYDKHGLLGPRSCWPTTCTRPTPSCGGSASAASSWRTARPATPRWAAGCSRSAPPGASASGSRSAPTSGRARASRCSRRGCRPTSPSSCSALEGHRLTAAHLLHLATAAGAQALGLDDVVGDFSVGKEYDALWLRPRAARPSTWRCGTPTPPTTRSPRPSHSPARPTYARPGSPAHRFVMRRLDAGTTLGQTRTNRGFSATPGPPWTWRWRSPSPGPGWAWAVRRPPRGW